MASPNPEAAIRALPGDELYYIVHEAGPRDALDILVHATASQLQVVMDFALWERDEIAPERLAEWLEVLSEAPPEKIGEWIAGLDIELVGLLLLKTVANLRSQRRRAARRAGGDLLPHARSPVRARRARAARGRRRGRRRRRGCDGDRDRARGERGIARVGARDDPHPRFALPQRSRARAAAAGRRARRAAVVAAGDGVPLAQRAHGRPRFRRSLGGAGGLPRARPGERPHRRGERRGVARAPVARRRAARRFAARAHGAGRAPERQHVAVRRARSPG